MNFFLTAKRFQLKTKSIFMFVKAITIICVNSTRFFSLEIIDCFFVWRSHHFNAVIPSFKFNLRENKIKSIG